MGFSWVLMSFRFIGFSWDAHGFLMVFDGF